jgi:hypothetical protein
MGLASDKLSETSEEAVIITPCSFLRCTKLRSLRNTMPDKGEANANPGQKID